LGGDPIPGPLSRFIPPIDEYLDSVREKVVVSLPPELITGCKKERLAERRVQGESQSIIL